MGSQNYETDVFSRINYSRVFIGPGAIALTLMRRLESSFAAPRVKCSTGAFEPAYAVYNPVNAANSEVTIVMILPPS